MEDSSKKDKRKIAKQIEELRRICCEKKQIEQDQQGLMNCLCIKRGRNPTNVSQLLTQIQDVQNKVQILCQDARECFDLESGSCSGATHVPSKPSTFPSARTMPHCYSGLLYDTRFFTGTSGNVFERPPAQEGRPSTVLHIL